MKARAALLCVMMCWMTQLSAQTGFGKIHIGDPRDTLPLSCQDSCIYQSQYVYLQGTEKVDYIEVIYEGQTFLMDEPIHASSITLAQAIRQHSLQEGMKKPVFGYASDSAEHVYGVVDLANHVVYTIRFSESRDENGKAMQFVTPLCRVTEVSYVSPSAPLLETSPVAISNSLLEAAKVAQPYVNNRVNGGVVPLKAADREDALDGFEKRVDDVTGQGKIVASLVNDISIWFQIDKDNPDCVSKSKQLEMKYLQYWSAYRSLESYAKANTEWLHGGDLEQMPDDLNKRIERGLRQLRAMGFDASFAD